MLTNAATTRAAPGARLLHTTTARSSTALLRAAGPSSRLILLDSRRPGQSRHFRFGRWSCSSESETQAQRELRSRHGRPKYRYIGAINRKLSWDHNTGTEQHGSAMKNMMAGRYVDADKVKSWSDELSGLRPGRNIEDVERNAINHLFQSHSGSAPAAPYEYDPWQSPFDNMRNLRASKRQAEQSKNTPHVAIDPITNRRIPSQDVNSADHHVSSFAHFTLPQTLLRGNAEPAHSNGPPPPEELKNYNPIKWMEPNGQRAMSAEELSKQYKDLNEYGPVSWREPSGAPPATAEEKSKAYADLGEYGPVSWREPNGLPPRSAEERSKQYSDLAKYKLVQFNEPNGQLPPSAEELSKQYEDVDKYEAVQFNEPHGRLPPTAEEQSKQYEDLQNYEAVQFNEPHGQLPMTAEEQSKQYDDLDKYEPVQFNEPDGQLPPSAEVLSKEYNDLAKYNAVRFNEPNGQLPPSSEELSKQYEDLDKYEAIQFNEPLGQLPPTSEELSKQYDDLHKYGPIMFNEPDGQLPPSTEELSKQYADVHQYGPVMWNEPDGQLPPSSEVLSKNYKDLNAYTPVQFNEPDGQLPKTAEEKSKEYNDLKEYIPVQFNEPDGKLPLSAEEKSKKYEDLGQYEPVRWNEPDGQPAEHPEQASKRYNDLHKYQPVRHNEPDGKTPTGESEQSDLHKYEPVRWNEPDGQPPLNPEEASKNYTDLGGYSGPFTHNEPDGKPPKHNARSTAALDDAMTHYGRDWDTANKAALATIKQARLKAAAAAPQEPSRKLTGNYVRDFPEDFAVSWTRMLGEQPYPNSTQAKATEDESEIASFDESFPSLNSVQHNTFSTRLEPALNRAAAHATAQRRANNMRSQVDPYSTEPQGLELSYAKEVGGRTTWPTFVRMYGAASDAAAAGGSNASSAGKSSSDEPAGKNSPGGSASGPKESPEPSHYKILAYDSTMQAISTADTTSVVKDNAVPLTPPEVMMRLSNPIKFFPHLAPLQAQGYEIISGSGDVLVFRKVRDAQPGAEAMTATQPSAPYQPARVNPIDMMGSEPVTPHSYSASPTGFVNYDNEGEVANKPPPPFRARPRTRQTATVDPTLEAKPEAEPKKSNRGKKILIGAVSVGGLAYAGGVVGEFFKTGGNNGKGPATRF